MIWLLILLVPAVLYFGIRVERWRIQSETAREKAAIHSTVREAHLKVSGMDEDELDRFVYGDDTTPVGVRRDASDSSRG